MRRMKEKGQVMAEFALVIPILILLLFGMTYAAFYAFRAASADWAVFITGVASGAAYNNPDVGQAQESVLWPDLRDRLETGLAGGKLVRSQIAVEDSRNWVFGIQLIEAQRAGNFFRNQILWSIVTTSPI
ncbi:MAG: hypothetical protein CVU44_14095 [Chloroflexi bacterium HGW-Chloroflexi-6]|nr:MAG: hypothetical protein CVU44_14095 [Chloroflexi bacterium HGW-Chloroflexi-6]